MNEGGIEDILSRRKIIITAEVLGLTRENILKTNTLSSEETEKHRTYYLHIHHVEGRDQDCSTKENHPIGSQDFARYEAVGLSILPPTCGNMQKLWFVI